MEIIGYIFAIFIGISLGLIGGGGSILTVPLLVYIFSVDAVMATAYSLFIVGSTSLVGTVKNLKMQNIDVKVATIFAIPALLAVYSVRRFLMPILPETFMEFGDLSLSKDRFILLFFAIIMLIAAYKMIIPSKLKSEHEVKNMPYMLIFVEGLVVGAITGFIGAGGGFLIIPALVLLVGMEMKRAVATSLFIISVKSLIGFIGDVQNLEINWPFLLTISGLSIAGIFIGMYLSHKIDGKHLKKAFGYFVLLTAVWMIGMEVF